jgi:hypothetical protein
MLPQRAKGEPEFREDSHRVSSVNLRQKTRNGTNIVKRIYDNSLTA